MPDSGYCSLIIRGDNLDLDAIEDALEMAASKKWKKGEKVGSIVGECQDDYIRFDEKPIGEYNQDKVLKSLLDKLIIHESYLKELKQKASMFIVCYIQSDYAQITYMLSATALNKVAQLGIDFKTSIFSWGGVEDR